jgi:hypothetical protein
MPSRAVSRRGAKALLAALQLGALLVLLPASKDLGSSELSSRPLPAPEPPATTAPLARDDSGDAPKKKAPDEAAAKPKRPSGDVERAVAPSEAVTPPSDEPPAAPVATASETATAAAPASAPVVAAPSAACLSRCQGAMQGCLSAPVDGGVPGFGNLEVCKKALEACQAACAKQ